MENVFSHELVSVIKRACFARHGSAARPTLLVIGSIQDDLLLRSVLDELALDSTLSTVSLSVYDDTSLQRALSITTIILAVSELPRCTAETLAACQKPLLEWRVVKRDACPLFWPAHSVMDFFIVHQDSLITSPMRINSQEGEEQ